MAQVKGDEEPQKKFSERDFEKAAQEGDDGISKVNPYPGYTPMLRPKR